MSRLWRFYRTGDHEPVVVLLDDDCTGVFCYRCALPLAWDEGDEARGLPIARVEVEADGSQVACCPGCRVPELPE